MALVATVGAANANSYVTVREGDIYFAERANSSKYDSVDDKEAGFISASRLLDWLLKFHGYKASTTQSMEFPREDLTLPDGTLVPNNIIPMPIKYATFELMYASIGVDRMADSSLSGIEQVKAGPLFVKATPAGYGSTQASAIPENIKKMLYDYTVSTGIGVVRLMRG